MARRASRSDTCRDESKESVITDRELAFRDALIMWLRWNEAHERVTAQLFGENQSQEQLEMTLDQIDQLRAEAIRLSRDLLDREIS